MKCSYGMLFLLMRDERHLPKKFALIGLPGSGKSTFAYRLGEILDIPVHHLDRHMFEPDGKKRDKQEFIEIQKMMLNEKAWVIEGCSFSTFEMRFARADVLIYFHFSRLVCFWRLFKRLFNYKRDFGGLRAITWEILKYTWNFDKEKRARIEELREKYPQTDFLIFRNQKDADLFLRQICDRYLNPAEDQARSQKESQDFFIEFVDKLSSVEEDKMTKDLVTYESSHGIDVNYKKFSVVLKDDNGIVLAALNAFTAFAEIYVDDMWVDTAHRRKGFGKKLLQELESHFKGKGFNNINLVTSAFQAPGFYEKCGFQVEFVRINKKNPKLTKTFFIKFFNDDVQTQGVL